ncbi:helix-turn-helix transcriptional regulator [Streptomyces sp. NBC_00370]|uniref:helix-turn-helix transcriptional regulator n=1 Tax=Streptomyces sp. NBC_00370 TaxID=2975728 RepID=UPI002E2709F1
MTAHNNRTYVIADAATITGWVVTPRTSHPGKGPLAEYLSVRRSRVLPEQHELAGGGHRQVPGLRRDEVAVLAGISTDYYTRLEQGRERHPSHKVTVGIGQALALKDEEVQHLLRLASLAEPEQCPATPPHLAQTQHMLDSLHVPALLSSATDIVSSNKQADALFEPLHPRDNLVHMVFGSPAAKDFFLDWDGMAVKAVNCLRMFVDHYVKMADLAERLTRESEDFSRLWADHTVGRNFAMSMPVRHPRVGEIRLTQQILNIPGAEDNVVLIFPPVDAPAAEAVAKLA